VDLSKLQRGQSNSPTSPQPGWLVATVGTLLVLSGSALRSSNVERKRKPPGTL